MFYFSSQTGPGCDESQVHQIPYGTTKKMMKGALYQFNCDEGAVLSGSPTIFCDGKSWNDTAPTCLSKFFFKIIKKTCSSSLLFDDMTLFYKMDRILDLFWPRRQLQWYIVIQLTHFCLERSVHSDSDWISFGSPQKRVIIIGFLLIELF